MSENSREERTSISKVGTPQQIGEFWDSHSLADYSKHTREVSFEVDTRLTGGRVAAVVDSGKNTLKKVDTVDMPDKFSRICWNTAGWQKPTDDATGVETGGTYVATHHFGHEEWLFNFEWILDGFRYGFLQPIGKFYNKYKGKSCSILLYTITPERETLLVAEINDVYIPEKDELDLAFKRSTDLGWIDDMRADVETIGGDLAVLDDPKPAEIANIRFRPEDVKVFDPRPRVIGNHRIARKPKYYHPFDWDDNFPETVIDPPPYDEEDPARSERERTRAAQEGVRVDPRHVRLQNRLYKHLCKKYGKSNVRYERNYVDLTLYDSTGCTFFEIKMDLTVKRCIRSALGQLLEYAHYPESTRARRLIVVGDVIPTDDDRFYVSFLRDKYQIPIYYSRYHWETNELDREI